MGRQKEALRILEGAARRNGRDVMAVKEILQNHASKHETVNVGRKATLADLVRTKNLRRNALSLFFSWFLAGLNFFGFTQSLGRVVGGNIFVTTVIAGETRSLGGRDVEASL